MRAVRLFTVVIILGSLVGCATAFSGNAHVEDVRAGCEKKCSESDMQLAGMVYMGEYSDACVCEMKGKGSAARDGMLLGSAGAGGGAAGVWMQTVAAQERQHH